MKCQRPFPEELLTGYMDRALTQSEEQQVRLHVESCTSCRQLIDEMSTLREAAASTPFATPAKDEWDELPKTLLSGASRSLGWLILLIWAIALVLFVGWQVATSPGAWTEKALIFGSGTGLSLLLLSAFLDRRRTLRTDRYTRVRR